MEAQVIDFYLKLSQCQLRNKPLAIKVVMTALKCDRVVAERAYAKLPLLKYMNYATLCSWYSQVLEAPAPARFDVLYRFETQYGKKALDAFEHLFHDIEVNLAFENTGS